MTEEQHILLAEIGNIFWNGLGKLTAEALSKMPEELHGVTLAYLQDKYSVYGSPFQKFPTPGDNPK